MQNSRFPMFVAIVQNLVNIAASSFLVFVVGMKVEGVALGTVIALYAGLLTAVVLWMHKYGSMRTEVRRRCIFARSAMTKFFNVNKDIFLRTLCLVSVTVFFTSAGAAQGDVVLAVNTLLMQLFLLFSYIMDGFAYSAEALTGKCIGGVHRQDCFAGASPWLLFSHLCMEWEGRRFWAFLQMIHRLFLLLEHILYGQWLYLLLAFLHSCLTACLSVRLKRDTCSRLCLWRQCRSSSFIILSIQCWPIMRFGWRL